jgi:hypothetical protein
LPIHAALKFKTQQEPALPKLLDTGRQQIKMPRAHPRRSQANYRYIIAKVADGTFKIRIGNRDFGLCYRLRISSAASRKKN